MMPPKLPFLGFLSGKASLATRDDREVTVENKDNSNAYEMEDLLNIYLLLHFPLSESKESVTPSWIMPTNQSMDCSFPSMFQTWWFLSILSGLAPVLIVPQAEETKQCLNTLQPVVALMIIIETILSIIKSKVELVWICKHTTSLLWGHINLHPCSIPYCRVLCQSCPYQGHCQHGWSGCTCSMHYCPIYCLLYPKNISPCVNKPSPVALLMLRQI